MSQKKYFLAVSVVLLSVTVNAQQSPFPLLEKAWLERDEPVSGYLATRLSQLPSSYFQYESGVYRSVMSRITFRMPMLGNERSISVSEAIVSRRPDGQVITTKLIAVPGERKIAQEPLSAALAIVVTRLRDDRPKDRESVLRSWEPTTQNQRNELERGGVFYQRISTHMGEAVEVQALNRIYDTTFPFRLVVGKSEKVNSVGISRVVVAEQDSLIEFAQIFPCATMTADECRRTATESIDRVIAGVSEFLTFPPTNLGNQK